MVHSCGGTATRRRAGVVHASTDKRAAQPTQHSMILEDAMPFIPATDCAEAVIRQTLNGVNVVNVVKFRSNTGYDQGDIDALATYISTEWAAEFLPLQTNALTYVRTDVRGLGNVEDLFGTSNVGSGNGTDSAGTPLPANTAFAVKFTTGLTGRSTRGRIYIAGLNAADLDTDENTIKATKANAWVDAAEQVFANVPAPWVHVILSYFADGLPRSNGVTYTVNDYSYTDRRIDTMRRRIS